MLFRAGWVFAAALLCYINNIGNGFVYDDRYIVERNPAVQERDWKTLATGSYWGERVSAGLYRPVTLLSLGANRALGGPEAWSFHLVNDLLHALASVVVLVLAGSLGASDFAGLSAGLLFAVHPAHSEAVNAIVGRAEILSFLFALFAFNLYVKSPGSARREAGIGVSYLLALLAKESAAFAIPLFLLYDLILARQVQWRRVRSLAAALAVYLVIRSCVLGGLGVAGREIGALDNPAAHAPLWDRLLTAPILLVKYVLLLIAPVELSADYSFNQIPLAQSLLDLRVPMGLGVALALVLAFAHALRRGKNLLAFSLGAAVIPLFALLHLLFPLGTVFAERLAYLPSLGVCLAAGLGLQGLRWRWRGLAPVLLAALTGLGLARSFLRNRDWMDNETLFRRTVGTAPRSARSHFLLGTALFEKQDFAGAVDAFSQGLAIAPEHREGRESLTESRRALAAALYKEGRLEEALAVEQQVVEYQPGVEDLNQIGFMLGALGRLDEAEHWHRQAIERESGNAVALNYLGVIEERRGRKEQARTLYLRALDASPDLVPALLNAGSSFLNQGDFRGAQRYLKRASQLSPRSYEAFNSLGIAEARLGRREEAAAAFRRAMAIDPSLPAAPENLRVLEGKEGK